MPNQRILFVNQEIAPYLPSSPSADLGKALPQAIHGKGCEVRTFMPKYGTVNERRNQLHEVIRLSGINIIIDDTDHPLIIKDASMQPQESRSILLIMTTISKNPQTTLTRWALIVPTTMKETFSSPAALSKQYANFVGSPT